MSGLVRFGRLVSRRRSNNAISRWTPPHRQKVTPPSCLAELPSDHSSQNFRYFSSQFVDTNHHQTVKDEHAVDQNKETTGTMDRTKIREYRYFILHHCKKKDYRSAEYAESLLTKLVDESILQGRPLVNTSLHNNCLEAWAKSGARPAYSKASNLLQRMWERHEAHPEICPAPNSVSYHTVMDACARSCILNQPAAATRAEELIKEMESIYMDKPDGNIHPITASYNFVITAHANQAHDTYGAANAAEDWLHYLSQLNTEGGPGPDTRSFNIVLKAWKQCPENKGADRALELLQLMIKLFHEGHHEQVSPDHWSFGNVIQAFADRDRPEEAEEVLRLALSFYLDDESVERNLNLPDGSIDLRVCFNITINGWARSGSDQAPEKANALLYDMRAIAQETGVVITQPDSYTYTSCMEAMAKSGREDAPEIVESRLYSLVEQNRSGNKYYPAPTAASFDCAIRTWYGSQKVNRAQRMEAILNASIELAQRRQDKNLLPLPRTVNMCLKAWTWTKKGRERTMQLLNRMELLRCVDTKSYASVFLGLMDQAKENDYDFKTLYAASIVLEKFQTQVNHLGVLKWHDSVRHHYMELVKALGKVTKPEAADRAYLMVEAMESNTNKRAKPTTGLYTSVILAMARTPNPLFTQRSKTIFDHMMRLHYDDKSKVKLDTSAFVAMLTYLANTKEARAADHADSLLGTLLKMHMESRNDDKNLRPDYRCYDKCIQARTRCGDLFGAVKTLKRFVEEYRDARAPDVPSEIGIDVVYRCCIRDNSREGAQLAEEVLDIKEKLRKEGNLRQIHSK